MMAKYKEEAILTALCVLIHISAAEDSGIPLCPGAYGGVVWNDCLGVYTFPDGTKYIGKFRNNKFHGWGALVSRRRGTCVGYFENGKMVEKKCLLKPSEASPRQSVLIGTAKESTRPALAQPPFPK